MVKMLPVPTFAPELFCGYQINWIEKTKEGTKHQTLYEIDREKANTIYQTKYCQWLLQPLLSWCKQQEHLAAVQEYTHASRKEPICKLAKLVRTFLELPVITKPQTAQMLQTKALPLLQQAMPGRSSKYHLHTIDLMNLYDLFCTNQQSESISGQVMASEIPFS